jgi:hypothetical protein
LSLEQVEDSFEGSTDTNAIRGALTYQAAPGGWSAGAPTHIDTAAPLVEEVQGVHAYGHGQRVPAGHRRVWGEPDRKLGRSTVVPARVVEQGRRRPAAFHRATRPTFAAAR